MDFNRAVQLILVFFILAVGYTLFSPFKDACANGDTTQYCDGNTAVKASCIGVSWVAQEQKDAVAGEVCYMGSIFNDSCNQEALCIGEYAYVETSCVGGNPTRSYVVCPTKQYCSNGACVSSPSTCGNYKCENGETETTCYLDCGALSSWEEYYAKTPTSISSDYLECVSEFDCNSPTIAKAVADMEAQYQPKTPKEWIDSATKYVYDHVTYRIDGGNAICNERASDLFNRAYSSSTQRVTGNCIDYSTMFIAMARYKKMPSYQGGVCLTNTRTWQCENYALIKPTALPPNPLGYMSGNTTNPQVYGHSIVYIYNPLINGFDIVDPTMRESISKYCYGYSETLEFGIDRQVCYISNYFQNKYCQGY